MLGGLRQVVGRIAATAVLAATAGSALVTVAPTAAFAESSYSMESQFIAKMNAARESAGMRPYAVASDLTSVARSHSRNMASQQRLYHNPSLTSDVRNWQAVGENVGEGPTVSDIHTAFMRSPEHRANILDHDYTQVGVGVTVDSRGVVWVTEDFRKPMGASSASHTTTTTHHASSHPATIATHSARSTSATGRATSGVAAKAPRPAASPRAKLLARLTALRRGAAARPHAADPVAQAFDYLSTVSRLTGSH